MGKLEDWLRGHVERTSTRAVARRTGLAIGTISRLVNGDIKTRPDLETLTKLSEGLSQPLADLVEWTGGELGLPAEDDALVRRLRAEALRDPQLREVLDLLREAPPEHRRAVLTYLRGALRDSDPRLGPDEAAT